MLPALALGGAVVWHSANAYRAAFEARLQDTAHALALAVDREIGAYRAVMQALAASPLLDGPAPDLAGFEETARRASSALGTSIALMEPGSRRQIINTALPPGEAPSRPAAVDFQEVSNTARPMVTNLIIGAVAQRPVLGVAVPAERDGRVAFVVVARLEPARLAELLVEQNLGAESFSVIVDGNGVIAARSVEHEEFLGRPSPAWYIDALARGPVRLLQGISLMGLERVMGVAPVGSVPGWTVAVVEPLSAYTDSWRRPLAALAAGGTLTLLMGSLLALALARRLLLPVEGLARDARGFVAQGSDEAMPFLTAKPSDVAEFEDLRRGLIAADATLRARAAARRALDERQVLLVQEVDHRAKNALAVALSLVRLAERNVPPERFAASVEGRIAAMARAHSLLAKEAWTGADLRILAEGEMAQYTGRVEIEGPSVQLVPEAVQPVAMLLHELATNAAKHGALSAAEGHVMLRWEKIAPTAETEGALHLVWAETGGPAVPGPPAQRNFGSRLITQLAERQLQGAIAFEWREIGLQVSMTLPAGLFDAAAFPLPADAGRIVPPARAVPSGLRPPLRSDDTPPRVLVVEDDVLLSLELEAGLRDLGCEVVGPARTLVEALRLALDGGIHAAVLDVNLGNGERSFLVADLLETLGVPYLFATGYGSCAALAGREAGAVGVLQKPYARASLAQGMAQALAAA